MGYLVLACYLLLVVAAFWGVHVWDRWACRRWLVEFAELAEQDPYARATRGRHG